jgi:hypothetical protein
MVLYQSNHRAHAQNAVRIMDRNYGGVFILGSAVWHLQEELTSSR